MSRAQKKKDAERIHNAMVMLKREMDDMKRHNGVTPLHHHSLIVYLILRDVFRISKAEVLITGILHDLVEDVHEEGREISKEIKVAFGDTIAERVARQTHAYVSERSVPDADERRQIRYAVKLARVRNWDVEDCLVSAADIMANLFQADGSLDPIMLRKPPYWNWALREMIPALDKRLSQLGWIGLFPSSLVNRMSRYCGLLPMFDQAELERLDESI